MFCVVLLGVLAGGGERRQRKWPPSVWNDAKKNGNRQNDDCGVVAGGVMDVLVVR